ncbi:MAG: carboxypeptidase-like regulatory domain-containing protein, partial [Bryobacteraceae bacterium]
MRISTLLCIAVCSCIPSYAQQSTARLLGLVSDPSGANIAGAGITVTNLATSLTWSAKTGADGEYSISRLPIGEYKMLVEASGFPSKSLRGIVLQVDQEARFDVIMSLGSTNETITVDAQAPLLVTDTSSVGQVIENKAIVSMPLNGRAFWQLAQLTPGVVFTPGGNDISSGGQGIRATRVGLRISGSSRLAGGWFLDGFDITEYELGATSITPSTDALQEFKVLSGGMSAEYALPSVINAALKSGSNSFHGSAYEYLRNAKVQARNFFSPTVPPLKRNQFGSTFGGPIKKDAIFFFADYEGGRTRQGTTINSVVPTTANLDGNFAGGRPIF